MVYLCNELECWYSWCMFNKQHSIFCVTSECLSVYKIIPVWPITLPQNKKYWGSMFHLPIKWNWVELTSLLIMISYQLHWLFLNCPIAMIITNYLQLFTWPREHTSVDLVSPLSIGYVWVFTLYVVQLNSCICMYHFC